MTKILSGRTRPPQGENSKPLENIQSKLLESDLKYTKHPRECLDFVCVSDLAVWATHKQPMSMSLYEQGGKQYYKWIPGVQTAYGLSDKGMFAKGTEPNSSFTPIGTFLSRLLNKLALNDERLKEFSWYFGQAVGGGASLKWRNWPNNSLSEEAQRDLRLNGAKYQREGLFYREG